MMEVINNITLGIPDAHRPDHIMMMIEDVLVPNRRQAISMLTMMSDVACVKCKVSYESNLINTIHAIAIKRIMLDKGRKVGDPYM